MKLDELPPPVRRFLDRRIENVEQLEILLLVHHYPDRSWNAAEIADALRLTPRAAAQHLEALGRRDLLDVRIGDEVRYRFSPATDELTAVVKQVAETYRDHRGAILAFVTTRRIRSLKDFSDAFRLGGEQDDG